MAERREKAILGSQESSPEEAKWTAATEGAPQAEDYFRERAARADIAKVKQILKHAGKGQPPMPGDEIA